jgi:hypothetical protein
MRMRVFVAPIIAALAVLAAGCDPFSGPLPGDPAPSPYFIQHLEGEGTYPLEIDLGSASRNVYLAFANPAMSPVSGSVTVTGSVESFDRLLQRWSVAQLLSNVTNAPGGYRYNTGTYVESTVNGNAYRLGSINLYKYSPTPYLYARPTVGLYQPLASSQALCQAAIPGTGVFGWTLDMPDGVIASVLVRP